MSIFELMMVQEMLNCGIPEDTIRKAIMRAKLQTTLHRLHDQAYRTVDRAKSWTPIDSLGEVKVLLAN